MSDHYRPEDEAPARRLRAVLAAPIDEPPAPSATTWRVVADRRPVMLTKNELDGIFRHGALPISSMQRVHAEWDAAERTPSYFAQVERERAAAWTLTCTRARWFAIGCLLGSYLTWYWGIW